MLLWLAIYFCTLAFQVSAQSNILDPNNPTQVQLTGNFSESNQYILLITASSTRQGNFFEFASGNTTSAYFIKTYDLGISTQNFTVTVNSTTIANNYANCTLTNNYIDCTNIESQPACVCFQTATSLDSCVSMVTTQLLPSCASSTTDIVIRLTTAEVTPNSLLIPSTNPVTFQYLNIYPSDGTYWAVTITSQGYWSFPSDIEPLNPAFSFIDFPNPTSSSWPTSLDTYETVFKTQLLKHDSASDVYCRYSLTYSGLVRGIYVNDYPMSSLSNSEGLDGQVSYESTERLLLKASEYNMITIIGASLKTTNFLILDCTLDWEGQMSTTVNLQYFYYNETTFPADNYTVLDANVVCPTGCLRCMDSSTCVECTNGFIYQGSCVNECPSAALYPDYKNVCSSTFESLVIAPQVVVNPNGAQITTMVDQPDGTYLMILHGSSNIVIGNSPLVWLRSPYSLAESVPQLVTVSNVSQSASVAFKSIASSSISNSDILHVVFYPITQNIYDMNKYEWTNTNTEPSSATVQSNPTDFSKTSSKTQNYLKSSSFYIFELIIDCISNCTLNITSNGQVDMVRNDLTILFNMNFVSQWTYTYSKPLSGLMQLQFMVSKADYFSLNIAGNNFQTYSKGNPIGDVVIPNLTQDVNNCSISNCKNCQNNICLSCSSGFFLSLNNQSCVSTCGINKAFAPEGECVSTCGNTMIDTQNGFCTPNCNALGEVYSSSTGCKTCVTGCAVCASTTTCLTCQFANPLNTLTSCYRKIGPIFSEPNFNVPQTITLLANSGPTYAVIVADWSEYTNNYLSFINQQRAVPRIQGFYMMNTVNSTVQQVTLPAIPVPQAGHLTIHYIQIVAEPTGSYTNYTLTGFYLDSFLNFPAYVASPSFDYSTGFFEYNSINGLFQEPSSYQTVIAQKLYTHNLSVDINCQIQVIYSGEIRGFYFNSQFMFFDSTLNIDSTQQQTLTNVVSLDANTLNLITMTGYSFQVSNISFIGCVDNQNNSVAPSFSTYLLEGSEAISDTLLVNNNTVCNKNCFTCIDSTHCLKCESGFNLIDFQCQATCSNEFPFNVLHGLCDKVLRSQGSQLMTPYYDVVTETITAQYELFLGISAQIIVVAFPYQTAYGPLFGIGKSGNISTLAEATYTIIPYTPYSTILNVSLNIETSAYEGSTTLSYVAYTTWSDSIVLATYPQSYSSIPDLMSPASFAYVTSTNTSFTFNQSNTYYLGFFANCTDMCQLSFSSDGYVTIQADYMTFLFDALLESSFGPYTLSRRLTGITYLEIYVWNASEFSYNLTGSDGIFSYNSFILEDNVTVTSTSACPDNCQNCYKGQCLSCTEGNLLSSAGTCGVCSGTQLALIEERLCISDACEDNNFITRNSDSTCTRQCPNNGFYYEVTDGCTNGCDSLCSSCMGPGTNDCLTCNSPRVINSMNNTCDCPVGTTVVDTGECISTSILRIYGNEISQSCMDLQLEAIIRRDESQTYNITFTWSLASTTASSSAAAIQSYLSNQTERIIFIPNQLLVRNNVYNITVSYYNVLNEQLQNYLVTKTIGDYIPNVNIDGGTTQTMVSFNADAIVALVTYSPCLDLSTPLQVNWSFVSGDNIDVNSFYDPTNPLALALPKCSLQPGSISVLQFTAWTEDFKWLAQAQTISVFVLPEDFNVGITNGNRDHPQNIDLPLSGYIVDQSSCQSEQPVVYEWTCYKTPTVTTPTLNPDTESNLEAGENIEALSSENIETLIVYGPVTELGEISIMDELEGANTLTGFVPCNDPDLIFNRQSSNSSIVVPNYYFTEGDIMYFNLTATRGAYSDFSTTEIIIAASNDIALEIICSTCAKYSTNLQYNILGNVINDITNGESYQYTWTIEPSLPFYAFQNQLKILSNNVNIDSSINYIKITLNAQSSDYFGSTFSLLPINTPPNNGTILVFPTSGPSLTTYFNILTKNWDDVDLPLTYQFSYSYSDNPTQITLLTDFQFTSQTSTYLPGRDPTATIVIQAVAQDSYGSTATVNTTVLVTSQAADLPNSVNRTNTILSSLETYNPLETLKVVNVLNGELNQWQDNQEVSNLGCFECSGNGLCNQDLNRCVCNSGWTLPDCSFDTDHYQSVVGFRMLSLQQAQNNTQLAEDNTGKLLMYSALKVATQNGIFSNTGTLVATQNILENSLNVTNDTNVLSDDEADSVSRILSNMMSYSSAYDCNGQTDFTSNLRGKIQKYLDRVGNSSLSSLLTGESSSVINTDNFNVFVQKVRLCELGNQVFSAGDTTPNITFNINSQLQQDCTVEVALQYYAFSKGLLNCSATTSTDDKSHVVLILTDASTGQPMYLTNSTLTIQYPQSSECPTGCDLDNSGSCLCASTSVFNAQSQIENLFTISQLTLLFNIQALLTFAFWEAGSFWFMVVLTLWLFATFFVVRYKWPNYDSVELYKNSTLKTKIGAIRVAIIVSLSQLIY